MERRKKLGAGLMLLCGALTLLPLVVTAVSMAFLPDTIPVHYGVEGTVDRWGSKYECFIFPVITFVMGGLLLLCSWLIPCVKAEGSEKAGRIALIAGIILLLAFNMLNGLILYTSWAMVEDLGEVPELGLRVLLLLAALLLVALGAAMPHLKRNHWIGRAHQVEPAKRRCLGQKPAVRRQGIYGRRGVEPAFPVPAQPLDGAGVHRLHSSGGSRFPVVFPAGGPPGKAVPLIRKTPGETTPGVFE